MFIENNNFQFDYAITSELPIDLEAEIEKYVGLHQFNLCVKDNDFYIWNKKEEINISQYLKTNYNCNTEILTNIDNGIANYHFVLITKN